AAGAGGLTGAGSAASLAARAVCRAASRTNTAGIAARGISTGSRASIARVAGSSCSTCSAKCLGLLLVWLDDISDGRFLTGQAFPPGDCHVKKAGLKFVG